MCRAALAAVTVRTRLTWMPPTASCWCAASPRWASTCAPGDCGVGWIEQSDCGSGSFVHVFNRLLPRARGQGMLLRDAPWEDSRAVGCATDSMQPAASVWLSPVHAADWRESPSHVQRCDGDRSCRYSWTPPFPSQRNAIQPPARDHYAAAGCSILPEPHPAPLILDSAAYPPVARHSSPFALVKHSRIGQPKCVQPCDVFPANSPQKQFPMQASMLSPSRHWGIVELCCHSWLLMQSARAVTFCHD